MFLRLDSKSLYRTAVVVEFVMIGYEVMIGIDSDGGRLLIMAYIFYLYVLT